MKSGLMIPTGPPDAPCVEKWLMFGISTPSRKKRFSDGPPPLTIRSFRKAAVDATPGKDCTTLDMSRFPPALFSISLNPITRSPSGLSAVLRKGEATMFTSSRLSLLSSSSIGKNMSLLEILNSAVTVGL